MLRFIPGFAAVAFGFAPVAIAPGSSAAPIATVSLSPAPARPAVDEPRVVRVDGIAQFPKWTDMLRRWSGEIGAAEDCIAKTGAVVGCVPAEWAALTAQLRPLDRRAMLDQLNRAINRYPYVAAADNWGRADYWETPFEFLSRGGQCEDYAIAKFMLLRAMGFADRDLRILVVRDVIHRVDHAVLVVDLDGTAWLLDSVSDNVVPLANAMQYRAYYAIDETGWWLYTPNPLQMAANANRG